LKTTDVAKYGRLLVAGLMVLGVAACEDDKQPEEVTGGESEPLKVEEIIVQPRVATPGDTLLLTAVVTSSSNNEGDIPTLDWTATSGRFVEDDELSVRWVSPAQAGIHTVTAKATNSANSSSATKDVFIADGRVLIEGQAGEIHLVNGGPDFYFLRSSVTNPITGGVDVNSYFNGIVDDAVNPARANHLNVVYSRDGNFEAHAADSLIFGRIVIARNVYVGDFSTRILQRLTVDSQPDSALERDQFANPSFSPDSRLVAFGGQVRSVGSGPDSFHVFVHDLTLTKRTRVTASHPFSRALFPTFSTDGAWLTYVSDQAGTGRWDLYGSPVSGAVVDGSLASLKNLTNTGGNLLSGTPDKLRNPLKAWNPVSPILAIQSAEGSLLLVATSAGGASVTTVDGGAGAVELVWSPNGNLLGISTGGRVLTSTTGGTTTERVVAAPGDNVRDIAWSPNEEWLAYRVTRGGSSWFEVVDIGAGVLTAPMPVTATSDAGLVGTYRTMMSMSAAWTSANRILCPTFGIDLLSDTPGVYESDLSSLVE